jgi:glycosyltransferase involved in cell wall biosynthesis
MLRMSNRSAHFINVLVMTPLGPGGKGGIDRLMDSLRARIQQSPPNDIAVDFVVTRGTRVATSPFFFAHSVFTLIRAAATSKCDVVHINLSADGSTWRKSILAILCRLLNIPYVIHLHSGRYHTFWDARKGLVREYINRMFEEAAAIIVLGSFWAKLIQKNVPQVASRTFVLPNATSSISHGREVRASGSKLHILFLGRLGPNKGSSDLLRALASLRQLGSWRATLAGDGDVEEARDLVRHLGLEEQVSIPGWVDSSGTEELLRSADVLALPSRSENMPMSIVEAFAHGTAVVVTPVGSITDIVEHERTGLIVPVGDLDALCSALQRLLEDQTLRERLGRTAQQVHRQRLELSTYISSLGEIWKAAAMQSRRHSSCKSDGCSRKN